MIRLNSQMFPSEKDPPPAEKFTMKLRNKRSGYTLIELVIILGIAAVIGTISVMYLPAGFRFESELDATALALKVHLFDAQQKSISQNQSDKWGIHLDAAVAGNNLYKIFHGDSYSAGTVEGTVILPDSVEFLSPAQGNTDDIIFEKVTGGSLVSHSIVLVLAGDSSKSRYINVSAGTGLITGSNIVPAIELSVNVFPGSTTLQAGGLTNASVAVALLSGASESFTFSASNLPPNTLADFGPANCSPTCGSTMTLITSVSTPEGIYVIPISVTNGLISKNVNFILTVDAQTAPETPTGLSAVAGAGQITLDWTPPAVSGGSPITNYKVYRSTAPGDETFLVDAGNTTSYVNTGLAGGTTYYYKVSAVNSVGEGPLSNEASQFVYLGVPSAPILSRLVSAKGRVPIYWQAPSNNGGSAITNYKIYRGTSSGGEILLATAGNILKYLDDLGIVNGTAYYYKISAINAIGEGALSNELSVAPADLSLVFTGSIYYKGNLGGLAGADVKCQGLAGDASLGGTWKAWLSDSSVSASSRLYHSPFPYKRVDGVKVANSWSDLADGALSAPINISENNTTSTGYVWTNTNSNGSIYSSNSCNNWTSSSASLTVQKGYTQYWSDGAWTSASSINNCGYDFRIYCVEQ